MIVGAAPRQSATHLQMPCWAFAALPTAAQVQPAARAIQGVNVQKLANGIRGFMSYTVHCG